MAEYTLGDHWFQWLPFAFYGHNRKIKVLDQIYSLDKMGYQEIWLDKIGYRDISLDKMGYHGSRRREENSDTTVLARTPANENHLVSGNMAIDEEHNDNNEDITDQHHFKKRLIYTKLINIHPNPTFDFSKFQREPDNRNKLVSKKWKTIINELPLLDQYEKQVLEMKMATIPESTRKQIQGK